MGNDNRSYGLQEIYDALGRVGLSKDVADSVTHELNSAAGRPVYTSTAATAVPDRGAVALYYVGGFLVVAAMSVFLGSGWSEYGAGTGVAILSGYLLALIFATMQLKKRNHNIPAGLTATGVAALLPGLAFALFQLAGWTTGAEYANYENFYSYVSSEWIWLEVVGVVGSFAVLRWVNFSTVLSVFGVCLWFAGMDFAAALFGDSMNDIGYAAVALAFGFIGMAVGLAYDARSMRRHGFWPHLFGVMSAIGAWEYLWWDNTSQWPAIIVSVLAGAALIAIGTLIVRRIYITFGGIVLFGALSYATVDLASSALLSAPIIALLGAAVIFGGVRWQHLSSEWRADAMKKMPSWLRAAAEAEDTVFADAAKAHSEV